MEGKNIPPFITLSAAVIACVICILRGASLYTTLKIVLTVMIIFYVIGCIARKILVKINQDAEAAALEQQRIEQELAAKELADADAQVQAKAQQENIFKEENGTGQAGNETGSVL